MSNNNNQILGKIFYGYPNRWQHIHLCLIQHLSNTYIFFNEKGIQVVIHHIDFHQCKLLKVESLDRWSLTLSLSEVEFQPLAIDRCQFLSIYPLALMIVVVSFIMWSPHLELKVSDSWIKSSLSFIFGIQSLAILL